MKVKKQAVIAALAAYMAFAGLSVSAEEQNDLFARMAEANSIDALQEKYEISWMNSERYYADGTVENIYAYLDSERYILDDGGDVTADKDGEVYGYNLEEGTAWRGLFLDGAYEDYRDAESLAVAWADYEDADVHAETVEPVDDTKSRAVVEADMLSCAEWLSEYGYTAEQGDIMRFEFTADTVSGEISDTSVYLVKADGTQTLFEKAVAVLGGSKEPEEPDMGMRDWIFSDNCHALTVIAGAGTEGEKTYVQTVGMDCQIKVIFAKDDTSDGNLYDDAACTQIHRDNGEDSQKNVTVYVSGTGKTE